MKLKYSLKKRHTRRALSIYGLQSLSCAENQDFDSLQESLNLVGDLSIGPPGGALTSKVIF
jgi:hypothetical protein